MESGVVVVVVAIDCVYLPAGMPHNPHTKSIARFILFKFVRYTTTRRDHVRDRNSLGNKSIESFSLMLIFYNFVDTHN